MPLPLHYVKDWSPFHIDALGLITILGADQVDSAVGRLVRSRYAEHLPLLGTYVIADGQFTQPMPGFALYSIKGCMTSTDLAGWFTRWLSAQSFQDASSKIRWTLIKRDKSTIRAEWYDSLIAALLGSLAIGFPPVFTALLGDWWGFASTITMLVSVFVRAYLLKQNRDGLDAAVDKAAIVISETPHAEDERTLVVLSNGKAITMLLRKELIPCFIGRPQIPNPARYLAVRYLGWVAFGGQIVTIGMSALASQIVMLIVIISSTWLTVFHHGSNDHRVGSRLSVEFGFHRGSSRKQEFDAGRRRAAYIGLELSHQEEEYMINWALMPSRDNTQWWEKYEEKKLEYAKHEDSNGNGNNKIKTLAEAGSSGNHV